MRISIDLDTERAVLTGTTTEIAGFRLKRQLLAGIEVQFVRRFAVVELPIDATGIFSIKRPGRYDEAPLTGASAWVKTGTGAETYYTFVVPLVNAALDALFYVDGDLANDVPVLTFMGEVTWRYDSRDRKTQTLAVAIENDVNRDDDVIPESVVIYVRDVLVVEVAATEDLPAFSFVTAGGKVANSATLAHLGHVAGMTPVAVASGFIAKLIALGETTNKDWSWPATNAKLFLNGTAISTTPPATGFLQQLGLTRNSETIIIEPGPPIRL